MKNTIRPCRSCNQDIRLVLNMTTQRWMPVDVDTNPVGNITVDVYRGTCDVLTGDQLVEARADETIDLHLAHHVTCPKAEAHRKPHVHDQALFTAETNGAA